MRTMETCAMRANLHSGESGDSELKCEKWNWLSNDIRTGSWCEWFLGFSWPNSLSRELSFTQNLCPKLEVRERRKKKRSDRLISTTALIPFQKYHMPYKTTGHSAMLRIAKWQQNIKISVNFYFCECVAWNIYDLTYAICTMPNRETQLLGCILKLNICKTCILHSPMNFH